MVPNGFSPATLNVLQELCTRIDAVRQEIVSAAETLQDEVRKKVCRRLAEHLGRHTTELRQVLRSHVGDAVPLIASEEPVDSPPRHEPVLMPLVVGDARILKSILRCKVQLKGQYDQLIRTLSDRDALGILTRQRQELVFGELVLQTMQ